MESISSTVGPWAKEKLECLRKYLEAYTTIMSKQSWCEGFVYVDAFAGPGRHLVRPLRSDDPAQMLLAELSQYQPSDIGQQEYINGSPRVALSIQRPFTKYYFTELAPSRLDSLLALKEEFAGARNIEVISMDCNEFLVNQFIRLHDWRKWRAIVFLDPFGRQVQWQTIKSLSKARGIEIFLNLPVWMAIQRFLKRHGDFTQKERESLNVYFGTDKWASLLYKTESRQPDLLSGELPPTIKKVPNSSLLLVRWYRKRLRQLFAHVSSARLIKSARGRSLYCLIHATHNPTGGNIADEILRQGTVIE